MTRLTTICISFVIVSLMFAGQCYADIDPETLLGAWLFDEGTGSTTADVSGNGNDGTLVGGPAWVAGQFGNALEFDGSSSYVDCGNAEALNVGVFSVSFWLNLPSSTQGWNHIVSRGQHYGGSPGAENWGVMMTSGAQRILFETYNDTAKSGIRVDTTAGEWHHIVATFDGDMRQLYHDGALADSGPQAGMLLDQGRPLFIGAQSRTSGPSDYFAGSIDDVGYFSVVLGPEDVLTLMNDGLAAVTGVARPFARRPDPENGAQHVDTWISLAWTAGDFAVSHDVYMSDNFDDVNDGAAAAYQGNVGEAFVMAGFFGFPFPDGLVPGTTYYWRVDEINDADPNSPWKGNVWSFWIPPMTAYDQSPSDGVNFVDADVTLTWAAGLDAKLHYVHFGDNFDDVNNSTAGIPSPTTTFTPPGALEFDKTYYWRVDESNPPNPTVKGDVWSFTTTLPGLGTAVMERWENIQTTDINALKNNPRFPNNPDVTETADSFSWNGADIDDYGGRIEGWVYVPGTGDYTFWLNTDDQGELWLSTNDDSSNVVLIASESSYSGFNSWGTGEEQSAPIPLIGGEKYYIMALWKEGGGGDHCQVAWQGPGVPERTVIAGKYLSPFEPLSAYGAKPSNRATGVTQMPILTWRPGLEAASHEVYFGTDEQAVADATKASPEYKASKQLGDESLDPGKLAWDTTYFWRVDQINNANPDSPWVGAVWSFTTADFLIVDDFESYDDVDPTADAPNTNRIFDKWIDGFGTTTNGALVGNDLPPYAERTVVRSGYQSMIYRYDNAGKTSEATLTLVYPRDWTDGGVTKLSLWINGNSVNAADRIFVALNGTAVKYHDDPAATQIAGWTEWVIDLAEFGVNLTNVNSITIGVGTKNALSPTGGTGTIYVDDIRLIR
ncbi:MAG: LamG-like jellyroll fold domain-containing protein [Planctomycetota bacterium]